MSDALPPADGGADEDDIDIDAHEVRPVDAARLIAWLSRENQRYFVGGDGRVGGIWNGCVFTFVLAGNGRVLQVRGQWNRLVAIERRAEMIEIANARHARSAWPKCFLLVLDDGSMRVAVDHGTVISHGLSERQLDRAMRVGLASGLQVFGELDARFPDPVSSPSEGLA